MPEREQAAAAAAHDYPIALAKAIPLGPCSCHDNEPEIIIDNNNNNDDDENSRPTFVEAWATPVVLPSEYTPPRKTMRSYTVLPPPPQRKRERRKKVVRNGMIGGVCGLLVGGPIGAIVIGAGSAIITKKIDKKKERKVMRDYQNHVAQQAAVAVSMERHSNHDAREQAYRETRTTPTTTRATVRPTSVQTIQSSTDFTAHTIGMNDGEWYPYEY